MEPGTGLPEITKLVTQNRIEQYAAASGDFNPIHVDEGYAATTQFGGTIAHGMMVAATISEVMTYAFGMDWYKSGKLKLRFKAPVRPGETVTTFGEVRSKKTIGDTEEFRCTVGVRRPNGETVITGEAIVGTDSKQGALEV